MFRIPTVRFLLPYIAGTYLRGIAGSLPQKPRAILVISGHWEEKNVTVNTSSAPAMLFDYYGFPPHTYQLKYPAPGSPELASEIREILTQAGIKSASHPDRGFDHGVFVPFLLMFPEADIPVVQMSLLNSLNAEDHLALGRALAPLRERGVLIVGSGMSYHNMGDFRANTHTIDMASAQFDGWLAQTVASEPAARDQNLAQWANAPGARKSHPREEHLLPMMVAAGAAGIDKGQRVFNDVVWGKVLSSFQFG